MRKVAEVEFKTWGTLNYTCVKENIKPGVLVSDWCSGRRRQLLNLFFFFFSSINAGPSASQIQLFSRFLLATVVSPPAFAPVFMGFWNSAVCAAEYQWIPPESCWGSVELILLWGCEPDCSHSVSVAGTMLDGLGLMYHFLMWWC